MIRVKIDRWLCTGCGLCEGAVFVIESGFSTVRPEFRLDGSPTEGIVSEELLPNVQRAAKACPNGSISWLRRDFA